MIKSELSTERTDRLRQVLKDIQDDMAADARDFDGKPFNGRTVAEYFGHHGAAIAALARIIQELLPDEPR